MKTERKSSVTIHAGDVCVKVSEIINSIICFYQLIMEFFLLWLLLLQVVKLRVTMFHVIFAMTANQDTRKASVAQHLTIVLQSVSESFIFSARFSFRFFWFFSFFQKCALLLTTFIWINSISPKIHFKFTIFRWCENWLYKRNRIKDVKEWLVNFIVANTANRRQ